MTFTKKAVTNYLLIYQPLNIHIEIKLHKMLVRICQNYKIIKYNGISK